MDWLFWLLLLIPVGFVAWMIKKMYDLQGERDKTRV